MAELTADAAQERLRRFGGYGWIVDSARAVWTASARHRGLAQMGVRVAHRTVARDFDRWAPQVLDDGTAGKYTTRAGALIVLATRIRTAGSRK
jgi:hypothetical protein